MEARVENLQRYKSSSPRQERLGSHCKWQSLWIDIVKTKYLRNQDFLTVSPKPRDSRVWRDILKARTVLTKGLGWEIGNGSDINLFTERWIPSKEGITAPIYSNPTVKPIFVSDLIDSYTRKWRSNAIYHHRAGRYCETNYLHSTFTSLRNRTPKQLLHLCWKPHSAPYVTLNTDGACHGNPGPAGMGCVLRKYDGGFIAASVDYVPFGTSFLAEALAMRLGLYLAISYGITHINIQSDSQALINCIKGEDRDSPWEAAGIIEDIRQLFLFVQNISIIHIYREGNATRTHRHNMAFL
ncbi:hypothetical protein IFM89_026183 [Coptis chinensis]|uniref:RNase H type-1 domain-containing protein n=1 Tax=Coptis chinensis TaxID=261450 RepID=A0A835H7V2_9MAGN|nr:hypothetical protein IFM89_026183 [Coptis chinensis]